MMTLKVFTPLLFVLALTVHPARAVASTDGTASDARKVVETIISKAKSLDNKASMAQNAKTIESLVDFEKLSLDALGRRASEATSNQKSEIAQLLRKVITKTVYPEAPKFFRDVAIAYTAEDDSNGTVHITSVVTKGTRRSSVEYWLKEAGGAFKVVDFAVEGERWVANVHDQFDEIIGKHGVKGLVEKLRKRATDLSKNKS